MSELILSNNLAQIELEINHHKQIAGQSIWEIGRRLNHVKENDLVHGQFGQWLEHIGIQYREANRMMTVAKNLPNVTTLSDLGSTALYLIATLPDEAQTEQLERIEQGNSPTVRELQEVKRQLQLQKQIASDLTDENSRLKSAKSEVREVVREIVPEDYSEALRLSESLSERAKVAEERNAFLEGQLATLQAQRADVDEKSAKYDELTRAIEQSQGELNGYQRKIAAYKNILSLIQKGNEFLLSMGGLIYADEEKVLKTDGIAGDEFDSFVSRGLRFFTDLEKIRNKDDQIVEGEIL